PQLPQKTGESGPAGAPPSTPARVDSLSPTPYLSASRGPAPRRLHLHILQYLRGFRMIGRIARLLFGSANERFLKTLHPIVDEINALEKDVAPLSDEKLRERTAWLKKRLADGEDLDDILPDAFA